MPILSGRLGPTDQEAVMMENGEPHKRRQLSPEEKWEISMEVPLGGPAVGRGPEVQRPGSATST